MEDLYRHSWQDPLLLTDVSCQQLHHFSSCNACPDHPVSDLASSPVQEIGPERIYTDPIVENIMKDHYSTTPYLSTSKLQERWITDHIHHDPIVEHTMGGCEILGFSLTSPDLVICSDSPEILKQCYVESLETLDPHGSFEVSLDNGIDGSEPKDSIDTAVSVKFSTSFSGSKGEFELPPPPVMEEFSPVHLSTTVSMNVGLHKESACPQLTQSKPEKVEEDGDDQRRELENEFQENELEETKRHLEELKRLNEQKSRECQEAQKALKDLQNELMRKSMHVGSLAFAIEGQVKEKTKWFSTLRDLTRKVKIMKMDQIKLSEDAFSFKHYIEDVANMSFLIQLKQHVELHEDLKIKFIKGAKERKELYNRVLELKGNIRVFCRCRPLSVEEIAMGASMAIDFEAAKDGELTVKSNGLSNKKTFKFDAVFRPQAGQVEVFEDTAPLAASVLDGYNVCIFAYGQTGTGKTFTMEGTNEARGVNYRTLEELFRIINERKNTFNYEISVSVLEVYNEQIRDLLVSETQSGMNTTKRLEIKQVGEGAHRVPGLVEAQVNNMDEVWDVLQTGSHGRAVGSTNANEHSSRSHCIHCVMVKGENLLNGECTRSKLWLIDLAGSERIAKTEVQGERLKETQNINRSLSALGDVISALANKSPHIPFRNSKLTHLLQDSLGGDSKTLMFVQISPNENDLSETLCSLNFASRVRGIELGPAKKQLDNTEILKYKQMVEKNKLDMKTKDFHVKKMEDTIHGLEMKVKERDVKVKNLQDKIKELESQLLVERKLSRQHVDSRIAEQQQQLRQQHDDQNAARPPFSVKTTLAQANLNRPLSENNKYNHYVAPSHLDPFVRRDDVPEKEDKENNPGMEHMLMPKRTGRASFCPALNKLPSACAPRRNSLNPLPSVTSRAKLTPSFFPLTPIQATEEDVDNVDGKCLPEPLPGDSPTDLKFEGKKLNDALRRSINKRLQLKSPMLQTRRGVNVGIEKVRVSIGSRRVAHRVLLGTTRRVLTKEGQQKQSQREKERGWNAGTNARGTVL
ncbi:hypothetical protein DM860_017433 [Cuscuta australis]|uniref:Kinesin motor domain-containing protein n=1 Tax=Cuscuta australis TaxID=267555 RepID=A0A328DF00_9ASTE|nr:hypothetical protein DM860_017433 [Cuscuta australis]